METQDGPLDGNFVSGNNCVKQTEGKKRLLCKHHQFYVSCLHRLNFPVLNVTISKRANKNQMGHDRERFESSSMPFPQWNSRFYISPSELFSSLLPSLVISMRKGILRINVTARTFTKRRESDTWDWLFAQHKKKLLLHFRGMMFVFLFKPISNSFVLSHHPFSRLRVSVTSHHPKCESSPLPSGLLRQSIRDDDKSEFLSWCRTSTAGSTAMIFACLTRWSDKLHRKDLFRFQLAPKNRINSSLWESEEPLFLLQRLTALPECRGGFHCCYHIARARLS